MKQLVVISNNQIVVSSKDIAEHFGKDHKVVLRAIREHDDRNLFHLIHHQ